MVGMTQKLLVYSSGSVLECGTFTNVKMTLALKKTMEEERRNDASGFGPVEKGGRRPNWQNLQAAGPH